MSCYQKNYRGITLLPMIYKLFEKLILDRIEILIKTSGMKFPDSLQCAYQPGRGESKHHAIRALSEPYPLVTIRARKMSELKGPISADKGFH